MTETHLPRHHWVVRAVTIREAKAHLNELVEAAGRGEQVVLLRGSKHVAAIVPVSADDLELSAQLTDRQVERLWGQLAAERRGSSTLVFDSPELATAYLSRGRGVRKRGTARRKPAKARAAHRSR